MYLCWFNEWLLKLVHISYRPIQGWQRASFWPCNIRHILIPVCEEIRYEKSSLIDGRSAELGQLKAVGMLSTRMLASSVVDLWPGNAVTVGAITRRLSVLSER